MSADEETLVYVEIDLNYCANAYGESPCTAAGSSKCWNTRNIIDDCQDIANFTASDKTLRFAKASNNLFKDVDAIPSLESVSVTTPRIKPGVNLGERFSATFTFSNHPHGDAGLDKYWGERAYTPYSQGTFWGKFSARNPFLKGRPIRIKQGFASSSIDDFEVFNLVVDNFSGPDANGVFSITAVDIFRFLDDDKAQAPIVSNGYLSADITDAAGSATLAPTGIGDLEYPASGKASIGKELVNFTRSGDVLTLTRGQNNTAAEEHSEDDVVQIALEYTPQTADLIIADLIENYTDLTSANIPAAEWAEEIENYADANYSTVIGKPTGVRTLINELIEQVGLVVWPEISTNQIKLNALRPVTPTAAVINDDYILDKTFKAKDQQEKRISQVWTYFNLRNPLEKLDDPANFFSIVATIGQNSDQYTNSAIKKVFSRWIPQGARPIGSALNAQLLSRFESPPKMLDFKLPRSFDVSMGQGVFLTSRPLEKCDGSQRSLPAQIVSIGSGLANRKIVAEEMTFIEQEGLGDKQIVFDYDVTGINLREAYDLIYSSLASDEDITVRIESGVFVGGQSYLTPALEILDEDWPSGVTITIINVGRIAGAGGKGGTGGASGSSLNGQAGGTALKVTRAVTIDNTDGEIYAGGGGGGGTQRYSFMGGYVDAGGGGGAGYAGGVPGNGQTYFGTYAANNGEYGTRDAGGDGAIAGTGGPNPAGDGGDPGQAGTAGATGGGTGGAAGVAVDGDSFITWTAEGDIVGSQVN